MSFWSRSGRKNASVTFFCSKNSSCSARPGRRRLATTRISISSHLRYTRTPTAPRFPSIAITSAALRTQRSSYDATDAPTLVLQNVYSSFQQAFPFHPQTSLTLFSSLQQTTDIGLTQNSGDTGLCFEIWFRKRKTQDTYTLQAVSPDVKEAWTRDLERILWEQAVHNRGRNRTRSGDKLGIFLC